MNIVTLRLQGGGMHVSKRAILDNTITGQWVKYSLTFTPPVSMAFLEISIGSQGVKRECCVCR